MHSLETCQVCWYNFFLRVPCIGINLINFGSRQINLRLHELMCQRNLEDKSARLICRIYLSFEKKRKINIKGKVGFWEESESSKNLITKFD